MFKSFALMNKLRKTLNIQYIKVFYYKKNNNLIDFYSKVRILFWIKRVMKRDLIWFRNWSLKKIHFEADWDVKRKNKKKLIHYRNHWEIRQTRLFPLKIIQAHFKRLWPVYSLDCFECQTSEKSQNF